MPTAQPIQEMERMLAVTRKAYAIFDAFALAVRQEILLARFQRDQAKVAMLEAALKSARSDLDKMEKALGRALLSTTLVDSLEAELGGKASQAEELLQEMERLGKTLDRIAKGAEIAAQALQTVTRLIA
jgi:predicted transcriptional regulator